MTKYWSCYLACLSVMLLSAAPVSACDVKVSDAWIREAPPGMMTSAGYASLTNPTSKPISITQVHSPAFAEVQMHETVMENGMASMHAVESLLLAPHQTREFKPGGLHLMMMSANKALRRGDTVKVQLKDQIGCVTEVAFTVRAMQ